MESARGSSEGLVAGSGSEREWLLDRLTALRADLVEAEASSSGLLQAVPPDHRDGARNLIHYVALRSHDLRVLQERLSANGLSSLGRAESHVLAKMDAVLSLLSGLAGREPPATGDPPTTMMEGWERLERNTERLLGPLPRERRQRVLVTMPEEAADDPLLVRRYLAAGMDIMRINCAQGDEAAWASMIAHLRRAEEAEGRSCLVEMDLRGPGVRIGPIHPSTTVDRVAPPVDEAGWTVRAASLWLTAVEDPEPSPPDADMEVRVRGDFLEQLGPGDRLGLRDARGRKRVLTVVGAPGRSRVVRLRAETYLGRGTRLYLLGPVTGARPVTRIRWLPPRRTEVRVWVGDTILMVRPPSVGRPAVRDPSGRMTEALRLTYYPPEALETVRAGDPIWFDDGKAGGVVREVTDGEVRVAVTRARPEGSALRADKGINLPSSELPLPALSEQDRRDLDFIVRNADIVGYSFARSPDDVAAVQEALAELGGEEIGLVLKVETAHAFERLPEMLLGAMRSRAAGVMVARGDLAVELGFERLAEVQEEILWLAEAAHLPVIWATEVLRDAAKRSTPRRAELTDAAMAARAEAVMLNKGPYIVETIRMLTDILQRMEEHQRKKMALFRPLSIAEGLTGSA
jgi:pyruvate kinase